MNKYAATLKLLADAEVNFALFGGFAARLYGSGILTNELAICYQRTPENLQRLASALAPIHPRLRGESDGTSFALNERTLTQGMNFALQTDLVNLDLLGEIPGVGQFPDVARDAVPVELYDTVYLVGSLTSLIKSKRAADRPKDRNALPELEALKELKSGNRQ